MLTAVLIALVAVQQTAESAPRAAPAPELVVVIATPVYQPDGSMSIETATLPNGTPSVVHVYGRKSLCDTATAGATEPTGAAFGWRLTSHTVSATESELVVSVDWQRLWDRGQRLTNGPSGTVQLKLHPGDRIALDHIPNPAATDACRAVGMGLEVKIARTGAPARPDSRLVPLGAVEGGAATLDADLWLVHTLPPGTQQAHHQKVKLPANGSTFSFTPVELNTARGDVKVEISGSFRRFRAPTGGEFLFVSLARSVSGGELPAGGITSGTGTVIPLPGPAEVLSIEIPAAGGRGQGGGGFGGAGVRSGGGGARGGGGGGRGGGVAAPPVAGGPTAAGGGGSPAPGVPRGGGTGVLSAGGRGAGGERMTAIETMANEMRVIRALDGNNFSLRLRLTPATAPMPGM